MIKKLMSCIREFKTPSLLSAIFIAFEVIFECIIPYIIAFIIDNITTGNYQLLATYSGILIGLSILSFICGFISAKEGSKASTGFARNIRHDIFYSVQDFSFSNIDKFSSSSLVTRMTTDVSNIQMAYGMIIRIGVRAPLMLIVSIIMAFTLNYKLALIFVALVPILGFILIFIAIKSHPIFERVFKKYDNLNASVNENVKGIRTVKTYVREDYEKQKFGKASDEIATNFIKAEKLLAWNPPAMQFAMNVALILVSVIGSYLIATTNGGYDANGNVIWGELSTGSLSSLISYGMQCLSNLMMITMVLVMIMISLTSMERVVEVLNEKSNITNPINPIMKVDNGDISFKNVNFKYNIDAEEYALKNVNLKIKSGQVVGILGGTGASKSTLVNLISRLYDTTTGEIGVGDHNVKEYDLKTLRDQVSVVLQKNLLFSGTIKQNMLWGNENATDDEILEACKLAQADEFIETFPDKYQTIITQGGTNVSGGQKQRLCIARALLKKPKILILDDSTSAVDTKTDSLIRDALSKSMPDCTKIVIAQRISSLKEADLIIVMDKGKIIDKGTHDELLKSSKIYKEIYDIQNRIS